MCHLGILGFVGMLLEKFFFNNGLCVYVLVGSEIFRCVPHWWVVSHLLCGGLGILWVTWSILNLNICIEFLCFRNLIRI